MRRPLAFTQPPRGVLASILALSILSAGAADDVAMSPYGPDDQAGALNQLDDASRYAILSRIGSGRVYDLSVENFPGMPGLVHLGMGDPDFHLWMTHTPGGMRVEGISITDADNPIDLYDDAVIMSSHTGTHLDALNHVGYCDRIWNGFESAEHLGNKGWRVAGADAVPPIITRGVLIDVAGHQQVTMLPESYEITPADLEAALAAQKITLAPGDAVFIRTGRMTAWPDIERYVPHEPGIALAGARWLIDSGAVLIGADNIAVERIPIVGKPVHSYAFAERGVCLIENAWLEDLARDGVYEFVLIAAPIKVRGATGSSLRPLAIPLAARP
jgi:kynurenine formamidase